MKRLFQILVLLASFPASCITIDYDWYAELNDEISLDGRVNKNSWVLANHQIYCNVIIRDVRQAFRDGYDGIESSAADAHMAGRVARQREYLVLCHRLISQIYHDDVNVVEEMNALIKAKATKGVKNRDSGSGIEDYRGQAKERLEAGKFYLQSVKHLINIMDSLYKEYLEKAEA